MTIYDVNEVFTPTQPARKNFIKRKSLDKRIQRAIKTPGMQVILYGHSGSGKTTLLLNKLKELNLEFVKTNCTSNMSFNDLLSNVYMKLGKELPLKGIDKEVQAGGGKINIPTLATLDSKKTSENITEKSFVCPYSSIELALAKTVGEQDAIWVIEDFHKLKLEVKTKLAQLMKVFMDLSDEYPHLKIIALGAKNTAREVVELDTEMQTRVSEIHVPLMDDEEICKIIKNGCRLLNISTSESVNNDVIAHSHGVASICHQLCLLMCESADIDCSDEYESNIEFDHEHFNFAASEYIQQVSDTLKSAFQKALKVEQAHEILTCLTESDIEGVEKSEFVKYINENFDEIEINSENLEAPLQALSGTEHGNVLMYNEQMEYYSFKDPFYMQFAKLFLKESHKKKKRSAAEMNKLFNQLIIKAKRNYSNPNDNILTSNEHLSREQSELDDSERLSNKWKKSKSRLNMLN